MRQLTRVIAGLAVAIGVWACLPFSRTIITSPPIVGVYRAETGEPLANVQLAIGILNEADSLCAPSALRTVTDSAGHFSFPLTEKHEAMTVLAPFESSGGFSVCARVAGAMRRGYEARTAVGGSISPVTISLTCIESRTPNTKPVVCTKRR
jgi:hypothetical protein